MPRQLQRIIEHVLDLGSNLSSKLQRDGRQRRRLVFPLQKAAPEFDGLANSVRSANALSHSSQRRGTA